MTWFFGGTTFAEPNRCQKTPHIGCGEPADFAGIASYAFLPEMREPYANYYCDGNTGMWTAIPWTVNTNANLAQYSTVASAASTPALLHTGTLYTGGTGTTTTPHWYINQSGTAPSTWNAAGTHLGVNAASGFTGNFLDFHVNGGSSVFLVNYGGQVIGSNTATFNSFLATGGTGGFRASLYTPVTSSAACITGTVAWDASYLYVCKAMNTWMRSALSSF